MRYKMKRKCAHCGNEFTILGPKSRYCSAQCTVLGRAVIQGDCWIFENSVSHRNLQITYKGQHYGLREFSLENWNRPVPLGSIGTACGNVGCVNPDHLSGEAAYKTRKKRRTLTHDEVLRIAHGGEDTWTLVAALNICPTTVQSIRFGRTHSSETGIPPKPKKPRKGHA